VAVNGHFDAEAHTYALTFTQTCPATPGQTDKLPFVIPMAMGLLDSNGRAVPLRLQGEPENATPPTTRTLVLTQASHTFVFTGLTSAPVPSLLRGFSAPVVLKVAQTPAELLTLLAHDADAFNRWEAGQRLALQIAIKSIASNQEITSDRALNQSYIEAMRAVLRHPELDAAFKELVLTLPAETYMAEQLDAVDPQRIHAVRESMREALALALYDDWVWAFGAHQPQGGYTPDANSSGQRALVNLSLQHLCIAARARGDAVWPGKALQRFKASSNMTDRLGAVAALVVAGHPLAHNALERFHALFKDDALVIDKWFALQAGASDRDGHVLTVVKRLMAHPDFNLKNPNRARSVITTYCQANPAGFHRIDAAGYVFWADQVIELDAINPQVAARLARALDRWKQLTEPYRSAAREAIARVAARPQLSNDVREVVTRALAD
jgi:aminopeptidase N